MQITTNRFKKIIMSFGWFSFVLITLIFNNSNAQSGVELRPWGLFLKTDSLSGYDMGSCISTHDSIMSDYGGPPTFQITDYSPDFYLFSPSTLATCTIDFGDGSTYDFSSLVITTYLPNMFNVYPPNPFTKKHRYNYPGTYTIETRFTFDNGRTYSSSINVIISNDCNYISGYFFMDLNGNCIDDFEPRAGIGSGELSDYITQKPVQSQYYIYNGVTYPRGSISNFTIDSTGAFIVNRVPSENGLSFLFSNNCVKPCDTTLTFNILSGGSLNNVAIGLQTLPTNTITSYNDHSLWNYNYSTPTCASDTIKLGLGVSSFFTCQQPSILRWHLYWGDGQDTIIPNFHQNSNSFYPAYSHVYSSAGLYMPYLIISDILGWSDTIFYTSNYLTIQNCATGIKEKLAANYVIGIQPNPVKDVANLIINTDTEELLQVRIVNMLGETIYTEKVQVVKGSNTHTISTNNLASGIYFMNVTNGSTTVNTIKFVK